MVPIKFLPVARFAFETDGFCRLLENTHTGTAAQPHTSPEANMLVRCLYFTDFLARIQTRQKVRGDKNYVRFKIKSNQSISGVMKTNEKNICQMDASPICPRIIEASVFSDLVFDLMLLLHRFLTPEECSDIVN